MVERWFELWDAKSGSLVGTYGTEEAAVEVVRRSLAAFGDDSVRFLVLTAETAGDADPRVVASGAALADLARKSGSLVGAGRSVVTSDVRR